MQTPWWCSRWLVLKNSLTIWTQSWRSRWLPRQGVGVVVDHAEWYQGCCSLCGHWQDYTKTFGKLSRLLTDFKVTIRRKKVVRCIYTPIKNNLKIWKPPFLKKTLHVHIVVDHADTQFLNFAIKYLRKNKKVSKIVFACSYGAL